ncbi:MAG: tyrosine-type recombinase/integrase, partial [Rhodopila sp.]
TQTQKKAHPNYTISQKHALNNKHYEKSLPRLERDFGDKSAISLMPHHVMQIRNKYAWRDEPDPDHPGQTIRVNNAHVANKVVTTLSILMTFARLSLGWRKDNPASNPKRLKPERSEGYRPWTQDEFKTFMDHADEEWQFNALLALLTGQRSQDLVAMRWSDYNRDKGEIKVVQKKAQEWVATWIPCPPPLKDALDKRFALLRSQGVSAPTILVRQSGRDKGKSYKENAFQHDAGEQIASAGLEVVWHGLRGAAASWAAEEGATDHEIAALLGHTQVQTTRRYSRGAKQRKLANAASKKIVRSLENIAGTKTV